MNALKSAALSLALVAAAPAALAQSVTFTSFADGSQAVRGVLSSPNVTRDLTVSAGGFDTQYLGASFVSYCVDFYQWLPSFGSVNNSYTMADAGSYFGDRLDSVERLFSGRLAQVDTAVEQAAFQIALWEIRYEAAGNAFRWAYTLRLPVDDSVYEVQFDDWMYLVDERVMLNKAVMSKFGIRLGEVTLSFTKN